MRSILARIRYDFLGQKWLGNVPLEVSCKALKLVTKQHHITSGWLPTKLRPFPPNPEPCTGQFSAQYGIPCSHKLLDLYKEARQLQKTDFHPFWWLIRSLADEDHYLQLREPDRVEVLRGRPRNSAPFTPDPRAPRSTATTATTTATITTTVTGTGITTTTATATVIVPSPSPEPSEPVIITTTATVIISSPSPEPSLSPEPPQPVTVTATATATVAATATATTTATVTTTAPTAVPTTVPTPIRSCSQLPLPPAGSSITIASPASKNQDRTKPSIRRKASQWEDIDLEAEDRRDGVPQGKRRTINGLRRGRGRWRKRTILDWRQSICSQVPISTTDGSRRPSRCSSMWWRCRRGRWRRRTILDWRHRRGLHMRCARGVRRAFPSRLMYSATSTFA
jgi:hypothetical protein